MGIEVTGLTKPAGTPTIEIQQQIITVGGIPDIELEICAAGAETAGGNNNFRMSVILSPVMQYLHAHDYLTCMDFHDISGNKFASRRGCEFL